MMLPFRLGACFIFAGSILGGAVLGAPETVAVDDLVIASNGVAQATVVVESAPIPRFAAAELTNFVQRATGACLPIVEPGVEVAGNRILLGRAAAGGLLDGLTPALQPEEFVILRRGRDLVLAGYDQGTDVFSQSSSIGTCYAVSTFLEDYVGVRWLAPMDSWTVVPERKHLAVGSVDRREGPAYVVRRVGFGGVPKEKRRALDLWNLRHKLSYRLSAGFYGHAFGDIDLKKHPEWAATIKGEKAPKHPCYLHPEVMKLTSERVRQTLSKPENCMASASPRDGGGFCDETCPHCSVQDDGERPGDLSRRIWFMVNEIAKTVGDIPGKYVAAYAYTDYGHPPRDFTLRDNVYVFMSLWSVECKDKGGVPERLSEWRPVAGHLGIRDHWTSYDGLPYIWVHSLAQKIKLYHQSGIRWLTAENYPDWSGTGIQAYIGAKLLWNPKLDTDALLADYCQQAYGPAAPAMERYYESLEKAGAFETYGKEKTQPRLNFYRPELLGRCEVILKEATAAAGGDALVKERIRFTAQALNLAQCTTQFYQEYNRPPAQQNPARLRAIAVEREKLLQDHDAFSLMTRDCTERMFPEIARAAMGASSSKEHFTYEDFQNEEVFRSQLESCQNVSPMSKSGGKSRSLTVHSPAAGLGEVMWRIRREAPIQKAAFSFYGQDCPSTDSWLKFFVSVDDGKSWSLVAQKNALSAKSEDIFGGETKEITDLVQGRQEFLLKVQLSAATGSGTRLSHVKITTQPE